MIEPLPSGGGLQRTPLELAPSPVADAPRDSRSSAQPAGGESPSPSLGGADRRRDGVELSKAGLRLAEREARNGFGPAEAPATSEGRGPADAPASSEGLASESTGTSASSESELTEEEQRELAELRARDREVRAHEQAHAGAGGSLTGAPSYEYETGPDGNRYAVSGEVPIRLEEGRTSEETRVLAEQARRAALAPAEPSAEDRAVAAKASQMARKAERDRLEEAAEEPSPAARDTSGAPPATQDTPAGDVAPEDPADARARTSALRSYAQTHDETEHGSALTLLA